MKTFGLLVLALVAYYHAAEAVECNQWTKFYSRDFPSGNGDYELLSDIIDENPQDDICDTPSGIEARTIDGVDYKDAGQIVTISPETGFYCVNSQQNGARCLNYEVRFCCLKPTPTCTGTWSQFYNRDAPSGSGDWETLKDLRNVHSNLCANPSAIDARVVQTNLDYRTANENVGLSPAYGLWCQNKHQTDNYCQNYKVRFCCP
ncbi:hypothetical protein SNE40_009018 [Patella caerulea]|uniref:WxxW domain-containing protein n=1 Tax=Patella caerulea TaxID=87958 RepID=A0AAN8JT59_PATCE